MIGSPEVGVDQVIIKCDLCPYCGEPRACDAVARSKGGMVVSFQFIAALLPLNSLGHYIHWHWIDISVANFIVIVLMVVTFIAALLAPFPGRRRRRQEQ
jgi:hypothetical protein